jgi:hypothetical protein
MDRLTPVLGTEELLDVNTEGIFNTKDTDTQSYRLEAGTTEESAIDQ